MRWVCRSAYMLELATSCSTVIHTVATGADPEPPIRGVLI